MIVFDADQENKSKGLGDDIEKLTKATGIDKVVKFLSGEDCGCDERKEKLNKIFRYPQVKCLEEEEYKYLMENKAVQGKSNQITKTEQNELIKIFNRVFNQKRSPGNCENCWKSIVTDFQTLLTQYNE